MGTQLLSDDSPQTRERSADIQDTKVTTGTDDGKPRDDWLLLIGGKVTDVAANGQS